MARDFLFSVQSDKTEKYDKGTTHERDKYEGLDFHISGHNEVIGEYDTKFFTYRDIINKIKYYINNINNENNYETTEAIMAFTFVLKQMKSCDTVYISYL